MELDTCTFIVITIAINIAVIYLVLNWFAKYQEEHIVKEFKEYCDNALEEFKKCWK